jgi:hypothetical protein
LVDQQLVKEMVEGGGVAEEVLQDLDSPVVEPLLLRMPNIYE